MRLITSWLAARSHDNGRMVAHQPASDSSADHQPGPPHDQDCVTAQSVTAQSGGGAVAEGFEPYSAMPQRS